MEQLHEVLESILKFESIAIENFHADGYKDTFQKFEIYTNKLDALIAIEIKNSSTENSLELLLNNICDELVHIFQNDVNVLTSKKQKKEKQRTNNLFMAVYVLPGIYELRKEYSKILTKKIEQAWQHSFKNSKIETASYETVASGFQKRIFGFPI